MTQRHFRQPGSLAKLTVGTLFLFIVASVVSIVSDGAEIHLLNRVLDGEAITNAEFDNNDQRALIVSYVHLGAAALAGVVFLFWQHRISRNLEALGTRVSSWWAVAGWFIPIANLLLPYVNVKAISQESSPDETVHPLVGPWWCMLLVAALFNRLASSSYARAMTAEEFIGANGLHIAAGVLGGIAAALTAVLIAATTRNQERIAASRPVDQADLTTLSTPT